MKNSSSALSLVDSPRHSGPAAEKARSGAGTGIAVLDRDYRVVWCNAGAEKQLNIGGGRNSLTGAPALAAYLTAGDFSKPLRLEPGTGAGLPFSLEVLPFMDSGWLLLAREATAANVEAVRRDFVADTSHELRAPLCVLMGLIETLSELGPDPARAQEYFDLMGEQCKRMRNIVDGLLELSALEAMPEPGLEERVNMASLLARLRAEAEVLSGGRHRIVLEAQPGFDLLGSERDITSALGNLVANAVRYTQPGGEVRLLWQASPKGAQFTVEDTGMGIDAKHIPLLTERFYRVQKALHGRRGTGGTGLGLAIVKAVLSRHQAALEISSEAGKGSRFTAVFPPQRVTTSSTAPGKVSSLAA